MFCPMVNRSHCLLVNGVMFGIGSKEDEMMPQMPYDMSNETESFEVIFVDLEAKQGLTLSSFGTSPTNNSVLLLNEVHRAITCTYNSRNDVRWSWPSLKPITEDVFALLHGKSSCIKIDLNLSPEEIAHAEAKAMYEKQVEKEKALQVAEMSKRKARARQEARRATKEKMAQKYLNSTDHTVQGHIHGWRSSFPSWPW